MRFLFVTFLAVLSFAFSAQARQSQSLELSGVVPVVAEVQVKKNAEGRLELNSKSSPELKVDVRHRGPASLVIVAAP